MIEWLTGDPLNGIVVSLTFFISLIVGRALRRYSMKLTDSRIKILLSFILIIDITLMDHWYIPIAIAALFLVFAIRMDAANDYIKKLTFPVVIASFILIIQAYDPSIVIPFSREGFDYGLLIFGRVIGSTSVLILLIVTIPEAEFFEAMRWLKIPGTLIEISSFMRRYIGTFSAEGAKLKMAQESRCGFSRNLGFSRKIENMSLIAGSLIMRAFSRSDEVYNAMLSRGWTQRIQYHIDLPSLKIVDLLFGVLLLSTMAGLLILDRFL